MGRCTDSKIRSKKGEVVLINNILQLKIPYESEKYCNCHPETCTHFDRKVSYNYYELFEIMNTENVNVGEFREYSTFKGLGNNRTGVNVL